MPAPKYKVVTFPDGIAILGDSTRIQARDLVDKLLGVDFRFSLVATDPPYGNILNAKWDKTKMTDDEFASWMCNWTSLWKGALVNGGAFYCWGGLGKPGFRPFMKYIVQMESKKHFELSNLITWSKKRAYGTKTNYLFTREELAYFVKGDAKKPRTFNIPLLDTKRGYAGFNARYPAKSEFYRRTNVWTDIIELMQGKIHPTEKKQRVIEIPIEVHTNPGEYVLDPFAGCGTTAMACRKLGRKFVVFEQDQKYFDDMCQRLKTS